MEWAHGMTYASHRHRNAALPYWLFHYNERRPHSSLGDRPPISRVHNVCRQDTSLVVSDAHAGPQNAIAQVLGRAWQRCSVHFLRETLGHVRKDQQGMVAALLRPIFNAEDDMRKHASLSAARSSASGRGYRGSPRCSKTPRTTCSPSTPSLAIIGRSCAPQIRWNG